MKNFFVAFIAAAGLMSLSVPASAGIISADIEVVMDLEFCCGSGPSVSEVLGANVGPGAELTVADRTVNPSQWGGHIAVDIDDNGEGFTLFNDDGENVFQSATVTLSNIVSDMGDIIDVVMTQNDLFTEDFGTFSMLLGFTADSITFSVLIDDDAASSSYFWEITETGTAMFDISFSDAAEVSEPAMLGLFGLGLVGLGLTRRRVK